MRAFDRDGKLKLIKEALASWSDEEISQLGAFFSQDLSQSADLSSDKEDILEDDTNGSSEG